MQNSPDEGYIKFQSTWRQSPPFGMGQIAALNHWRQKLYNANLVGAYPDGIGFGNVSRRAEANHFYISGSKTGNFKSLDNTHYAKVVDFDIAKNWVACEGPVIASSESMSHAVIYAQVPEVNAVFHVHHLTLWKKVLYKIPTTVAMAEYGSPEMANEIIRLIAETDVADQKVFAMAGHQEGLFSFGKTLEEAGSAILDLVAKNIPGG
ncbi:MAG: L-ribulose-5-phosphate 4-epimerase [Saprospiraceae bacterium]|jgi:L-ribulose-5-phosphate 4-epimerase